MPPSIAKYSIDIDSNAAQVGAEAASSIEDLRDAIKSGQDKVKDLSAELRNLRGSSDEVKEAKNRLKAQFEANRSVITQSELALHKLGTSSSMLAQADRKLAQEEMAKAKAVDTAAKAAAKASAVGQAQQAAAQAQSQAAAKTRATADAAKYAKTPVGELKAKFEGLKDSLTGPGGAALAMAGIAGIAIAAASSVLALGSRLSDVAIDISKFVIASANQSRALQLNRASLLGNERDATALGSQIDRLSSKLPKSKEQLNEMSLALVKGGLSGKALVDSLEAVAGAGDDDLGNKIKGIVEAGKLTRRIQIGRNDLIGSGLNFDDVAKELATSMGVGIDKARMALQSGTVKIASGAEALKNAVNNKFGGINARKMLDLNTIGVKFRETLAGLASKVNLEPMLKTLAGIAELFSDSTVSGAALKAIVTSTGKEIVSAFTAAGPVAKVLFKGLIIAALDVGTQYFLLKKQLQDVFGKDVLKGPKDLTASMVLCSMAVDLLVFPLRQVQGSLMLIAFGVKTFNELSSTVQTAYDAIKLMGWKTLGSQVVEGFIAGIKGGLDSVRSALGNLGDTAKQALKKSLGIASPSKVMRELGGFTGDGYVEGVVDTHADAHAAIRGLGNASPDGARAGAAGAVASQSARSGITIQSVVVQVNAADKLDKSAAMSSDWVADMLARALEKSLIGAAA